MPKSLKKKETEENGEMTPYKAARMDFLSTVRPTVLELIDDTPAYVIGLGAEGGSGSRWLAEWLYEEKGKPVDSITANGDFDQRVEFKEGHTYLFVDGANTPENYKKIENYLSQISDKIPGAAYLWVHPTPDIKPIPLEKKTLF